MSNQENLKKIVFVFQDGKRDKSIHIKSIVVFRSVWYTAAAAAAVTFIVKTDEFL